MSDTKESERKRQTRKDWGKPQVPRAINVEAISSTSFMPSAIVFGVASPREEPDSLVTCPTVTPTGLKPGCGTRRRVMLPHRTVGLSTRSGVGTGCAAAPRDCADKRRADTGRDIRRSLGRGGRHMDAGACGHQARRTHSQQTVSAAPRRSGSCAGAAGTQATATAARALGGAPDGRR